MVAGKRRSDVATKRRSDEGKSQHFGPRGIEGMQGGQFARRSMANKFEAVMT